MHLSKCDIVRRNFMKGTLRGSINTDVHKEMKQIFFLNSTKICYVMEWLKRHFPHDHWLRTREELCTTRQVRDRSWKKMFLFRRYSFSELWDFPTDLGGKLLSLKRKEVNFRATTFNSYRTPFDAVLKKAGKCLHCSQVSFKELHS